MSEKTISPLRQRMIEDMSVRNFVEKTRNDYIRHVKTFTAFLGRSPETATPEDLRRFQLHQTQTGVRPPTINGAVVALRFFFTVTVGQAIMARHLTFVREPRKIPVVLSEEEIARLLEAAKILRCCCLGRATEEGCESLDVSNIVVARLRRNCAHVFDHALAQWTDGLLAHRGAPVLRWRLLTPLDPQDGTPICRRIRLTRSLHPARHSLRPSRAARFARAGSCLWHFSAVPTAPRNVGYQG